MQQGLLQQPRHGLAGGVHSRRLAGVVYVAKPRGKGSDGAESALSGRYTEDMQKKMGTTLTYRHEDGMNYNRILPDLIVGSCLQSTADLDYLIEQEDVRTIFCLQEDPDMAWFSLDIVPIQEHAAERGVQHVRFPIRDFDPFDLRSKLPKAVSRLARAHDPAKGTAYIHCTAGLGRAPATALAYMNWIRGIQLDAAWETLRSKRVCSPRIEAIRSATVDLLMGSEPVEASIMLQRRFNGKEFKVSGLDVGWGTQLDMSIDPKTGNPTLTRMLSPGLYPYKFVVDGVWSYSLDHPTVQDGQNINNVLQVLSRNVRMEDAVRLERLLTHGQDLKQDERDEIMHMLCPWGTHETMAALTPAL